MSTSAECLSDIAGKGADVGAFGTDDTDGDGRIAGDVIGCCW